MTGGQAGGHVRLLGAAGPVGAPVSRSARVLLVLVLVLAAGAAAPAGARARRAVPGPESWSAPRSLATGCALAGGPQVAFPSAAPNFATGPGAILWPSEAARCPHGASGGAAMSAGVVVAALGASERPSLSGQLALGSSLAGGLEAVGGTLGRVALAAPLAPAAASGGANVVALQDRATGPFGPPTPLLQGRTPSLAHAYLGDVAIAAVVAGPAIEVLVARHYASGFEPPRTFPIAGGAVSALTVTMDYRSDVLLAWQQDGAIHARMLRASGRTDPEQQLGPSAPRPQISVLVSDNDHGMVAWSSSGAPGASPDTTRVYVDLSGAGVRFPPPRLIASFHDPPQAASGHGSLALVRLSTENVLMAWTAVENDHYVVLGAPAVFAGTRPATRLSDPGSQSLLADLASGPEGEAIALWRSGGRGGGAAPEGQLWAARTYVMPHDRVGVRPPVMIASGPIAAATVGVDPRNDRAVAAWLSGGAQPRIQYAVSGRGAAVRAGGRPPASALAAPATGTHWLRISAAALGALAVLVVLAVLTRRRRGRRQAAGG